MPSPAATLLASQRNSPRSRSPWFWTRPSDGIVEDIVNNTKTALEVSRDLLAITPIPGMSAAIGAVITILEQVRKTKANRKIVKSFCDRTLELKATLENFNARLEDRINKAGDGLSANLKAQAIRSEDLKERIGKFADDVEASCAVVSQIGKQTSLRGFLSASRDEDALKEAEAGIIRSMTDFQMVGGITIEMLIDNIVNTVQDIRREQEAAAKRELELLERQKEAATQQREAAERQKEAARRQQIEEDSKTLKELLASDTELALATDRPRNAYVNGTRAEVFERLEAWRKGDESIFYLSGQLGRGKSVIASEFCNRYHSDVAAFFFFKRGNGPASSVERLVPVIAYQLAQASSALRPHMVNAAQEYVKRLKSLNIDTLIEVLLSTPLSAAAQSMNATRVYIVVDAVDECTDTESLCAHFLALFLPCIQRFSCLRLLVTSRPSPSYIRDAIHKHPASVRNTMSLDHDVNIQYVNQDIRVVIHDILRTSPTSGVWYSKRPNVIESVLQESGGLFVYACTVARFLCSVEEAFVTSSMDALLAKNNPPGWDELNTLYLNVLDTAFPTFTMAIIPGYIETVRTVLGSLALGNGRMCPADVERLLSIPCDQSISILQKLGSVIECDPPEDWRSFTPIHVTFVDFLLRPTSQPPTGAHFPCHIDAGTFHTRLAVACVRSLHENGAFYANDNWYRHFLAAIRTEQSGAIGKAESNEAAELLKELLTLLETVVHSMDTNRPSWFFCWFWNGLPSNNHDDIATLLGWIDQNAGRDVAQVFAEWIEMWRRQYEVQMNDVIVVKMRGSTHEDKKREDALKNRLKVLAERLWDFDLFPFE